MVEKFTSSPRAAANSFNVFNVPGPLSTKLSIAFFTKAVVAIFVELSVDDCVTTVDDPETDKSLQLISLSFNNTPSIVTPVAFVFSFIVSIFIIELHVMYCFVLLNYSLIYRKCLIYYSVLQIMH